MASLGLEYAGVIEALQAPFRTRAAERAERPGARSQFSLTDMVEAEIIPRLLIAHKHDAHGARAEAPLGIDVTAFAARTLKTEAYALLGEVEGQIARGISVETLMIDLLAPAARQLGTWWEDDTCDFVDVTMGLWRLQEIVHELAARIPGGAEGRCGDRRVLFAVPPGDQHGFGSVLVEEFFRRAGWSTWSARDANREDLLDQVSTQWFEIIGLTVTCDHHIAALPEIITAIRAASRNQEAGVMVGGRIFIEHPELAVQVGADGTAADGRQAVLKAETFLDIVASRPRRSAARV